MIRTTICSHSSASMGLRFLALACLVGAAFAGPVQRQFESRCAKQCRPSPNPQIRFEPGKAYVYSYVTKNNITSNGNVRQNATIRGTAELHTLTQCEGVLKIKNVRIEQRISQEEKDDLMKKIEMPMAYSLVDGKFQQVCPSPEESTQSLNIKKGILSSFVNEMSNLEKSQEVEERDSLGKCRTKYIVQNEKGEMVITKVKNLKTCTNRHTFLTSFLKKKLPSSLLFEDDHLECSQHIVNGMIRKVQCNETERLKTPLKNQKSLIEFSGMLELTHIQTKPAEKQSWETLFNPEEISYNIDEPRQGDRNVEEVERVLKTICSQNTLVMDMTVGKDYIKLVSLSKHLPYEDLYKIYMSLEDGTLCSSNKVRGIYIDTLPFVATDAAIKLMVKLMETNAVTGLKYKLWPASLALMRNPTQDTVAALVPLVKKDQSTTTLLGVTSLIHRLCSSENCEKVSPVDEIVSVFNNYLGSKCSSDDEKQVLRSLIAFGNMGYHGKARRNIVACARDTSKSIRIRLAAIDAFRRMNMKRPQEFVQLYSSKNENHEVRIACFDSVMKHADARQLKQMKPIAEMETNEQVSGYVYTYIQNMNKTRSPSHRNLKSLLHDVEISPPKVDFLKNSKHIELSAFNQPLNVGGSVETSIVQGVETKLPLSMRTSLNAQLFGKNYNIMEFGVRSDGLEDVVRKLIAMTDKIPNFEKIRDRLSQTPSLEELKKEINHLLPEKVFGDIIPELSMYFRTIDTELFDVSTSDLSGLKELLKLAEIMTKLAHGKDADFSHSFVFMNSKLIIPSVTGRSYSIDLAGSSTVGLTAKTKADLLKLPRNADIHFHFQPSVNLEISTTVGIQSNTHRPDVKHVSRLHLESDVEARFEVKDGHVAIASLTLPSENIVLANFSMDAFEIDQDHNEKRIFQKRQKKIDYCFNYLDKPLGVAACATVEVPKPFLTKTFPYALPFGNCEIALKKSDKSFKSYQFRIDIPKQVGQSMKYRASFDTPGSNIPRQFAADLEVKQQRDQKTVLVEFVSPFKTAGGSGSFTRNDQLMTGIMELHTGEKQIASANITSKIMSSRSRKLYEFSGEYSILNEEPARVDGSVTVIKGRKHHLSFDIRANKPQSKPIALKGTIMKEGRLELSQKSEWKLSSEISLLSPLVEMKLRKTLEKRSKQSEAISANIGLDYQLEGKMKHSLTFSGTSHKSSNKVNTQAKLELTENPKLNMYLTWDSQRESLESLKNNIKLQYGRNPERTYLQIEQKSRKPKSGSGQCYITIDAPHRNVHYELKFSHDMEMSENPKVNIESDICYQEGKHIKSALVVNYESRSPLKASGRLELEYPGGHYIYEDEIIETGDNVVEGKSKLQYKKGKVVQFQYKYKKLSNDAKLHHEIESSIKTPASRSPINGKASFELNSESLAIVGQVGPDYSIQAHLKTEGDSQISLKLPIMEGNIISTKKDERKTVDLDLKVKTRKPRHITGSVIALSGDKKQYEIRVQPDVDNAPEKRIFASTAFEMASRDSKNIYTSASRLQVLDIIDVSLAESGEVSLFGDQEFTLEASIKNQDPVTLRFKRQTGDVQGKMIIAVSKNNVEKAKFELDTRLKQTGNKNEFSIEAALFSPDHSFEDLHMNLKNQITRSGSSQNVHTFISFKKNDKIYKTELNSDIQVNGLEVKAQMQTPHVNYEKNAVGFSLQLSDTGVSSSVNIAGPDNKKISVQTEIKTKNHGLSFNCKLSTPFDIVKDAQIQVTLDNHRSMKSVEAYVDANNARVCDIQGKMKQSSEETEIEGSIKVSNLPKVKFQGLQVKLQKSLISALVSGRIQLMNNKEISLISEIKKEGDFISTTTSIATPYKNLKDAKAHLSIEIHPSKRSILCYLDSNKERKGDVELSIASSSQDIEVKGRLKTVRTPEMSAHVKGQKSGESFSLLLNVLKGTSPLLYPNFNGLSHHGKEGQLMKTKSFENTLLDLEISKDASSKNSNKYSLKVKGPFRPMSLTFSKNYNDKNSVSTELRACREVQPSAVCYSLKSYHKNLVNSENYVFYQKVTMDLEKSVGGSFSKAVGRLHVLMSAAENDYRSKITMELNEKKLGHEMKLHLRQHENDRCSLDSYIYLPQSTSRVRASILHSHHRVNFEADAIPNTDDPTRKLSLEMKKEINPDTREVSGYIKMSHPQMSQPLLFTCKFQPVGQHLYKVKLVLHTGPVWGKTLMIEAIPNIEQEAYGIRSMEYKMYTDDKSIDAYFRLVRQSSRSEKKIGYEWKFVSHDAVKRGGLTLTLSDKRGEPKTMIVSYFGPSVDREIQENASQDPDDRILKIASSGRKLTEIHITASDSCANIEVMGSGPLIKGQMCVNKREGSELQLLTVDVQYRQHKCLDIRVGVDPETPEYLNVVLRCKQDDACQALRELLSTESLVKALGVQKLKQKVLMKVRQVKQDVKDRVMKARRSLKNLKHDMPSKMRSEFDQHIKVVEEYIKKVKEIKENIMIRIKSMLPDQVIEAFRKYYQDYQKEAVKYYNKLSGIVREYWPVICYSNDIRDAFNHFDAKELRMLFNRKVNEVKQSLKISLPNIEISHPREVSDFIKSKILEVQQKIIHIFGQVFGEATVNKIRKYADQAEALIRQKVIDTVDKVLKKFHEIVSNDEDLQTAQDLILNAKDKLVHTWKNKERVAASSKRRVESDIKQNWRKLMDEQVQVLKYDPQRGDIRVRVRQPLAESQIEKVKEKLAFYLRKIREYMFR